MRAMKRILCALMALMLFTGSARAEFAPLLEDLFRAFDQGAPVQAAFSVDVEALPSVSAPALEAVRNQMGRLSLSVKMDRDQELLSLLHDGKEVLSLGSVRADGEKGVLLLDDLYVTPEDEQTALDALLGDTDTALPQWEKGRAYLWERFDTLYGVLSSHGREGEEVKATTSIKNVGASGRYIPYTLEKDQMNAAWQELLPLWDGLMDAMYPAGSGEGKAWLRSIVFTGDTEIRRVRDKEQNEWGFRVAAWVQAGAGPERKITLLVGWRMDKGFCLELKAPEAEGEGTLRLLHSGAYTLSARENLLKLEGSYVRRQSGESTKAEWNGSIRYTPDETGARLHGKITGRWDDAEYTLTPDFVCRDGGVAGTLALRKEDKAGDMKISLQASLAPAESFEVTGSRVISLSDMEEWEKAFVVRHVKTAWLQAAVNVFAAMPENERALITHVLRNDAWMDGDSVQAPETGSWRSVEEDKAE